MWVNGACNGIAVRVARALTCPGSGAVEGCAGRSGTGRSRVWLGGLLWLVAGMAYGDSLKVAVAANFTAPMQKIAAIFEQQTGQHLTLVFGGTGKFYAQIRNGAPFDVLLAADQATAEKLVQQGLAQPDSRFVYATGRLVLWSAMPRRVDAAGNVLRSGDWQHLALANPQLAPYGAAAMQVLDHMGLTAALQPKLVRGEDIGQTWQFVASGNADLGFVAYSQVLRDGKPLPGSLWLVPANWYAPIRQEAVVLAAGKNNPAAGQLMRLLRSDAIRALIRSYGYGT